MIKLILKHELSIASALLEAQDVEDGCVLSVADKKLRRFSRLNPNYFNVEPCLRKIKVRKEEHDTN